MNSDYDADRARLELARRRAELQRAELERDAATSRALLRAAVPDVDALAIPRAALLHPPTDGGVDALLAVARRARPDLAAARAAIAAADASAARWRREAVPSPDVWFGALATVGEPSASVLAGFALPLPVSDRRQGLVARAVAEARSAAAELSLAEARVDREVRDAWARVALATSAVARFRDEGEALAEDLGARAQRAYAAGSFTITDLLDAQRAIAEARVERLSAERAREEALADLADAAAALPFAAGQGRP